MDADLALLQRFSMQGDEEAFAEIVRRYAGLVFSTGYRVLADRARAEEVAQETFLRLAQKPYSVTTSVAGWLHRAATQLAIDVRRSDVARRQREREYAVAQPQQATLWAEVSPLVDRALDEMPEEQRLLLIAHFLEGRTQQAIAAERGVSAATLSRQMKSAVELLREKLSRHGIWAQGAALALWLTHHAGNEVPATLLRELGKVSMVSPSARQPAPPAEGGGINWGGMWMSTKRALPLAVRVTALVALMLLTWSMVQRWKEKNDALPVEHDYGHPATVATQ